MEVLGRTFDRLSVMKMGMYLKERHGEYFGDGYGDLDELVENTEKRITREGMDSIDDISLVEDETWSLRKSPPKNIGVKRYRYASPVPEYLPNEEVCRTGHCEIVEPLDVDAENIKGVVIILAFTGDEGFSFRRHQLAYPLAKAGYVTMIPIWPLIGKRTPEKQKRIYWNTVADYYRCCIVGQIESAKLVKYAREMYNNKPVGIVGMSAGALIASMVATLDSGDLGVVPYMPMYSLAALLIWHVRMSRKVGTKKELSETLSQLNASYSVRISSEDQPKSRKLPIKIVHAYKDLYCPPIEVLKLESAMKTISNDVARTTLKGGHITSLRSARKNLLPHIFEVMDKLQDSHEDTNINLSPPPMKSKGSGKPTYTLGNLTFAEA